jgi:hypothetical protein
MRYAVVVVAVLLAGPASAQSGAELCGRIGSQAELNECTAIVAGRRVDAAAVALCGRIGSSREIVECARAVAGRSVSSEAVSLCGRATVWGGNRLSRLLYPGQTTTVRLPEAGTWDICVEAPDGSSTFFNDLQAGEGGNALSVDYGREYPDYWQVRRPCRNF